MAPQAPALFLTGTDTGVGKTFVGAALAAALVEDGRRVGVVKPVETGWPDDPRAEAGTDAGRLGAAAADPDPLEAIVPYRFADPLAPSVAAARAGASVDLDVLVARVAEKRARADVVLVEGAGGILVPLDGTHTTLDLVVRLGVPALVVAGNKLGVINHTLLTVAELERAGVEVAGVVLNDAAPVEPGDLAKATNAAELARWLGARWLGHVRHLDGGPSSPSAAVRTSLRLDVLVAGLLS